MIFEFAVLPVIAGVLLLLAILLIKSLSRSPEGQQFTNPERNTANEVIENPMNPGRHLRYQEKHEDLQRRT